MRRTLALAPELRTAHGRCAYCPKLCRSSCPVTTVDGRETTTPWGKMTMAHQVDRGALPLSEDTARPFFACTGCMRCKTHCAHDNPVAPTLMAARASAMTAGVAPPGARGVVARHSGRVERARDAARDLFFDRDARDSRVAYLPGCTATVVDAPEARAGLVLTERTYGCAPRVVAEGCCGLPLLEAGDVDGFRSSAAHLLASLRGVETAVFLDPGCLHAMRVVAHEVGVDTRTAPHLVHLTEALDGSPTVQLAAASATARTVRYHDACRLGRGLGVYDAPRRLLRRALGADPRELAPSREQSHCSGAGGQLPATDAATARAIAHERRQEHEAQGGGVLVSACPAAVATFRQAGIHARGLAATLIDDAT